MSTPATATDQECELVGNVSGGGWCPGDLETEDVPTSEEKDLEARKSALDFPSTQATVEAKVLNVLHAAQIRPWNCGAAAGFMIARFLTAGASDFNGKHLSQVNMGDGDHMRTAINHVTRWTSDLFRIGINRWLYGRNGDLWWYLKLNKPTNAEFRRAIRVNIANTSRPFSANSVEFADGAHYNNHPRNQTIGHWVVIQGFSDYTNRVSMDDPSGDSPALNWASQRDYSTGSNLFNGFLQYNGIVW